jgi:hypothetical protein
VSADGISIESITPSTGLAGIQGPVVVISGTGFPDGAECPGPVIEVKFGVEHAFPLEIPSSTQVRVVAPALPAGPVEVTVTNFCSQTSDTITFTYLSPGILSGSIPEGGGFGLFVFGGGTNEELLAASGCSEFSATFWATSDGDFVTFIPGAAVAAVNEAWAALFPDGIPHNTALIGRCA